MAGVTKLRAHETFQPVAGKLALACPVEPFQVLKALFGREMLFESIAIAGSRVVDRERVLIQLAQPAGPRIGVTGRG